MLEEYRMRFTLHRVGVDCLLLCTLAPRGVLGRGRAFPLPLLSGFSIESRFLGVILLGERRNLELASVFFCDFDELTDGRMVFSHRMKKHHFRVCL